MYPLIAALWRGIQVDGDVREGQVLQRTLPPIEVLFIPCLGYRMGMRWGIRVAGYRMGMGCRVVQSTKPVAYLHQR